MEQKLLIQDDSNDKRYFTIIPNYILNHSTLWDRDLYIQMKRIAGEDGTCWTSQSNLAKQCGISVNRLKKSLKYLLDHKWIKLIGQKRIGTRGGNQIVNEYKIVDLWKINVDFYAKQGMSSNDTPITKGCHAVTKGVSPDAYKEEPLNNNKHVCNKLFYMYGKEKCLVVPNSQKSNAYRILVKGEWQDFGGRKKDLICE